MPRRALMPESRDLFALFRCCAENDAAAAMTIDADLYQVGAEWGDRYPDAAEEADTVLPVYPRRWYEEARPSR
ncbi:hypothetical protein [Actinomadura keratinilytica]|uniref:hypothetical protein n=1 Tax=Actinomadura keratinilytica TaxID=547461 RepID=UPI0036107EA0